uniref:Si:ch73-71c20.5 n=1 Tax=Seriola dumerili TaxID=41447 RepID=A0A3B4TJV1_SERDU
CSRPLHVSSAASLSSSKTEPQRSSSTDDRRAREEEEAEDAEYIPKKKAKNPMVKIGYAWMIGLPTGIISFILAKREVDKNRLKQLKIRQRMQSSNEGDYEGSRYRRHTEVNLDQ